MNANWPRWIFASATKIFNERCSDLTMFIEGQQRDTEKLSEYIEFRLDGPYFTQTSPTAYQTTFELNILVVCIKNDVDFHRIYRHVGTVAKAFAEIPVYKYGDGPDDDDSFVACFRLVTSNDSREALRISHFGQIDAAKPILQASVEGHYTAILTG